MSLDLSKLFNFARVYKIKHPNATVYDFLESDSYYKNLDEYDKDFALKNLINIFDTNASNEEKTSFDAVKLFEELNN